MKRIMVPTDFSQEAEEALKVAVRLAKKFDYEIFLLNVLELPSDAFGSSVSNTQAVQQPPESLFFLRQSHKRFKELLQKDYLQDVKVTDTVEFQRTFQGIIDSIDKYNIDLIVMGSNGASGLKELFIGSNTEKVVRNSKVPVLVIKEDIPKFNVKDFVFASDFEPNSEKAFWKANHFAHSFGANMHLVYINTPNKFKTAVEMKKKMKEFTADAPHKNFDLTVFNDYSIQEGILNFSKQLDAQLMGIATNGHRGLAHLLNGSISEDLVNHSIRPIITFRI